MKMDGQHRARFAADKHLADIPKYNDYSNVVSLCGLCLPIFLAKLNDLQL